MLRKINHGEVILKEVDSIPEGAKELKANGFFVVGESETVGNDHRVSVSEDTGLFEIDGVLYIKNTSPEKVFCPKEDRHGTVELPSSMWRVDIAQEYDYLLHEKRNVAD